VILLLLTASNNRGKYTTYPCAQTSIGLLDGKQTLERSPATSETDAALQCQNHQQQACVTLHRRAHTISLSETNQRIPRGIGAIP
jgi:hypothetical protein